MKLPIIILLLTSTTIFMGSCVKQEQDLSKSIYQKLDVQGHRGCRGSLPENTIGAFTQALEWGVSTLEMDVVISKDQQVILSHEPFMSPYICIDSLGQALDSASHFQHNIYQMTYQEIQSYDCGSLRAPGFPNQQLVPSIKPLLTQVVETIEKRTVELGLPEVRYNIETKSVIDYDHVFHPPPAEFASLVLKVIDAHDITNRTTIQSFDPRTLKAVRELNPDISVALLVDNEAPPLHQFIELGFEPNIYSPHYRLLSDSLIRYLHQRRIAVIPWTINDAQKMSHYIEMGVDGIITDYPELLLQMLGRLNKQDHI